MLFSCSSVLTVPKKFAEATTELAAQSNGTISIWLDGENISTATVKTAITDGNAVIEGSFTQDQVTALANQINSGSLPFCPLGRKLLHHQPHPGR